MINERFLKKVPDRITVPYSVALRFAQLRVMTGKKSDQLMTEAIDDLFSKYTKKEE